MNEALFVATFMNRDKLEKYTKAFVLNYDESTNEQLTMQAVQQAFQYMKEHKSYTFISIESIY